MNEKESNRLKQIVLKMPIEDRVAFFQTISKKLMLELELTPMDISKQLEGKRCFTCYSQIRRSYNCDNPISLGTINAKAELKCFTCGITINLDNHIKPTRRKTWTIPIKLLLT